MLLKIILNPALILSFCNTLAVGVDFRNWCGVNLLYVMAVTIAFCMGWVIRGSRTKEEVK